MRASLCRLKKGDATYFLNLFISKGVSDFKSLAIFDEEKQLGLCIEE